jgi:hypothetical protein
MVALLWVVVIRVVVVVVLRAGSTTGTTDDDEDAASLAAPIWARSLASSLDKYEVASCGGGACDEYDGTLCSARWWW